MATMQISREAHVGDPRPVLVRIVLDDGRVLDFRATAGSFSLGLADHKPFSVEALEPEVLRPRAI